MLCTSGKHPSIRMLFEHSSTKEDTCRASGHKSCFSSYNIIQDMFIEQLPGFEQSKDKQLTCKWEKIIYGLKQAARC